MNFRVKSRKNIQVKGLKRTKKLKTAQKNYFEQLPGAFSTQKLIKIHNKVVIWYFSKENFMLPGCAAQLKQSV